MILPVLYSFIELFIIIGAGYLLYKWLYPKFQLIHIEAMLAAQELLGVLQPGA